MIGAFGLNQFALCACVRKTGKTPFHNLLTPAPSVFAPPTALDFHSNCHVVAIMRYVLMIGVDRWSRRISLPPRAGECRSRYQGDSDKTNLIGPHAVCRARGRLTNVLRSNTSYSYAARRRVPLAFVHAASETTTFGSFPLKL